MRQAMNAALSAWIAICIEPGSSFAWQRVDLPHGRSGRCRFPGWAGRGSGIVRDSGTSARLPRRTAPVLQGQEYCRSSQNAGWLV